MMQPTSRREALRFAGVAVAALIAAACGTDGTTPAGGGPPDGGAPDDIGANTGTDSVADLAVGRWKLTTDGGSCVLTVEAGAWMLSDASARRGPLARSLSGTWALTAGVLQVQVLDADAGSRKEGIARPVPDEVGAKDAVSVRWAFGAEQPVPVPVARDGERIVVTFPNHDGALVITAERA